jgi:hypothetical protein
LHGAGLACLGKAVTVQRAMREPVGLIVKRAAITGSESGRGTLSKASATVEIDPRHGLFGAVRSPYM